MITIENLKEEISFLNTSAVERLENALTKNEIKSGCSPWKCSLKTHAHDKD